MIYQTDPNSQLKIQKLGDNPKYDSVTLKGNSVELLNGRTLQLQDNIRTSTLDEVISKLNDSITKGETSGNFIFRKESGPLKTNINESNTFHVDEIKSCKNKRILEFLHGNATGEDTFQTSSSSKQASLDTTIQKGTSINLVDGGTLQLQEPLRGSTANKIVCELNESISKGNTAKNFIFKRGPGALETEIRGTNTFTVYATDNPRGDQPVIQFTKDNATQEPVFREVTSLNLPRSRSMEPRTAVDNRAKKVFTER